MKIDDVIVRHKGNAKVVDALDEIVIAGNIQRINPVVIVGDSGTGKTCILKALRDVLRLEHSEQSVLHMRCEEYVNLYIEALQSNRVQNFGNRMKVGVKALLVDDIDNLVELTAPTFELTQRIDELMQDDIKIVLTSSVPIKELRTKCVTKQFVGRIAQGTELNLSRPDAEGCSAIVKHILERERRTLPQTTIDRIVDSFDGGLHSLVGQVHNAILDSYLEQKQETGK